MFLLHEFGIKNKILFSKINEEESNFSLGGVLKGK